MAIENMTLLAVDNVTLSGSRPAVGGPPHSWSRGRARAVTKVTVAEPAVHGWGRGRDASRRPRRCPTVVRRRPHQVLSGEASAEPGTPTPPSVSVSSPPSAQPSQPSFLDSHSRRRLSTSTVGTRSESVDRSTEKSAL